MVKETTPAKQAGKTIFETYDIKSIPADDAKYIFVGLPIINSILHVFEATNSANKYGNGFILAFFAKKQIKGVNVNTTISLEVNIVSIETMIYKAINNPICFLAVFLKARFAKYLKKPISSKNTDKDVILKNRIKILIGFIDEDDVNSENKYLNGILSVTSNTIAPNAETSQYVPSFIPFICTYGFTRTDRNTHIPTIADTANEIFINFLLWFLILFALNNQILNLVELQRKIATGNR